MRRIWLAIALVVSLLNEPLAAEAQQAGKVWKVGILGLYTTPEVAQRFVNAIEGGMRDLGYMPGKNFVFEQRYANGQRDRLPDLAQQLVDAHVDVIVAPTNAEVVAAKRATTSIPIVMVVASNPVEAGFAASLARPGGNITGSTFDVTPDTIAKTLELLKEAVPYLRRVALLLGPDLGTQALYVDAVKTAAVSHHIKIRSVKVSKPEDLPQALESFSRETDDALITPGGPLVFNNLGTIVSALQQKHLPAMAPFRQFVEQGGLMSYGANIPALWPRVPVYLDRIFRGTRPADIPIEQPSKFDLFINLKTAKALGLTIPQTLLLQADKVIE
jgi:putative ABC transport system substrate-binding protein